MDVVEFAYKTMAFAGRDTTASQALEDLPTIIMYHAITAPNRKTLARGVRQLLRELKYNVKDDVIIDDTSAGLLAELVSPNWRTMTWLEVYTKLGELLNFQPPTQVAASAANGGSKGRLCVRCPSRSVSTSDPNVFLRRGDE